MFQRILVPLDGSQLSEQALPYAVELAKRFEAELILMRVVPPAHLTTIELAGMESPVAAEMVIEEARRQDRNNVARATQYLAREAKQLETQGIRTAREVQMGDPARAILDYCQKRSVSLVVMTTRGRSGLKRALLGSVADEIVRHPSIPVLVIRPSRVNK